MIDRQGPARKLAAVCVKHATPLGRPTKERAAGIQDSILAAAFDAFSELGFDATTMEGVAERAAVSKGTLYSRFPDRAALFRAMLQDRIERWSAVCGAGNDRLPTELAPLLRYHARTVEKTLAWPELARIRRMIYGMNPQSCPEIAAFWKEFGTERFVRLLAADMAAASSETRGELPNWPFLARMSCSPSPDGTSRKPRNGPSILPPSPGSSINWLPPSSPSAKPKSNQEVSAPCSRMH